MKRFARTVIGLAIVLGAIALSALLWVTRPIAEKTVFEEVVPVVEVAEVRYEAIAFEIPSQGLVEASRRADLAAEVAGRVVEVNPDFKVGNRLDAGTWLLRLDRTDYEAAAAAAAAALADAESALVTEEARAAQAARDWKQLGGGSSPTDLTLRGPQVRSAKAQVESSRAALAKAEADLARCEISVPYDSVIAAKRTEVGNYLAPGTSVAEIFESGPYEVRLPLPIDQLPFLELNEEGLPKGSVELISTVAGTTTRFPARIVRTEGEIDRSSRSAYLVAEVDPTGQAPLALQPGLFVKASIQGRTLPRLARIPFSAFVDLNRVAVVSPDNTLEIREVVVVFRETDEVFVSGGLEEGERICLTELPSMINGEPVSPKPLADSAPDPSELPEPAPKPTL